MILYFMFVRGTSLHACHFFTHICLWCRTNCGSASDKITVTTADASQWPPTIGQPVALDIEGILSETLTGGTYTLGVTFDGFPVVNQQGSLSDLPNVTFPVPAGNFAFKQEITIPSSVPSGSIVLNLAAQDPTGAELVCLSISIDLSASMEQIKSLQQSLEAILMASKKSQQIPISSEPEYYVEDPENEYVEEDPENAYWKYGGVPPQHVEPKQEGEVYLQDGMGGREQAVIEDDMYEEVLQYDLEDIIVIKEAYEEFDAPVPVPWTSCASGNDSLVINSITASSWPPKAGVTVSVTVNATIGVAITAGSYNVVVEFDNFPIVNKQGNLADVLTLPVKAGPAQMNQTITVPASVPTGSININLSANDDAGVELFCVDVAFSM